MKEWRNVRAYTIDKYPGTKSMILSEVMDSLNEAYRDKNFFALFYIGACLTTSVIGDVQRSNSTGPASSAPETAALLHQLINQAYNEKNFNQLYYLGDELARKCVAAHELQKIEPKADSINSATSVNIAVGLAIDPIKSWARSSKSAARRFIDNSSPKPVLA